MPRRQFRRSDLYNDLDWTKYDQEVGTEDDDRRRTGTTTGPATGLGAPNPGIRTGGTPTAAGAGTRTGNVGDAGNIGAGTVTRGATAANRGTDRDHDQDKNNRGPQTGR